MSTRTAFLSLKDKDLTTCDVTLAIVKEYKRDRVSHYDIKYVNINDRLVTKLRNIVIAKVQQSNTFEEYSYDCPEPEEDQVRSIEYESTDFHTILNSLLTLNPEENTISDVNELVKAKAYMIILRDSNGICAIGVKKLPENWKLKRDRGFISLLYKENRFEDIGEDPVFSISNTLDFVYHKEFLFILSKKDFEAALNFRDGMMNNATILYEEVTSIELFTDIEILQTRVGNNQRYLRKIAMIRNLGHYKNPTFITTLKEICASNNWGIEFDGNKIILTEQNLDSVLTILQNKRLRSPITLETFDVDSAKPV